ncbi:MAG: hypothetical protein COS98_00765 [Parcubacteria group bacterium CG07_land_8_20_14_0_80_35_11]|nr:MAG: hypothetical protein COS98_00765 [Parcubacteria group bacterium CG07_land_8_20_14_0_80_35_11]
MRIKELIFDVKEPTVYCESFVYEPSNVEEERLGHLFMIGRIRNVSETSFYLINLLASRIKREYYSNYHRSMEVATESALKEGNKLLKENEERINWLGNLDFLVAAVSQKRIYFTLLGKMRAFIVRGEEFIDIVKNLILEKDVLFPFSTILQGAIKKDDVLIFSTSNIFSKEKLLKFGKDLFPIEEKKISKIIESEDSGTALIVETGKEAGVIERISREKEKKGFLETLPKFSFSKREKFFPSFKGKIKEGLNKPYTKLNQIYNLARKKISAFSSKISSLSKPTQPKKEEFPFPRITVEKASLPGKPKFDFIALKKEREKRKILFGGALLLILILIGFGFYQHKKNIENAVLGEIIKTIEQKTREGENSLIYGDKEKAISYFVESLELLNSIENPGPLKGEIDNLRKDIEDNINKILERKVLSGIQPLFEIKEGLEKFSPQGILFAKDNIYLFSPDSLLVYQWNISEKKGFFTEQREKVLGGTVLNKKPFFLIAPTSVVITEKEKILPIDFPYEEISVWELDNFLNYFYIFDKDKGEIIKYSVSQDKISSPNLWLEERGAAKGAVSIAIDGSVYLASPSGEIKKFSAGTLKEKISPPETYPKIKGVTKIFTSKDNQYLYLIEPAEKRVIILDKKGKIIAEYQSKEFKDLKDIWVTSGDKTIYLLSENKVFKIDL